MAYETYHIPVNFTDAGRPFGMFEIRNAIEAVLFSVPVLFFCIACLTRWLSSWWKWRKQRRMIFYRGEVKK